MALLIISITQIVFGPLSSVLWTSILSKMYMDTR